jgi:aspartate/methionine/tyrosine aminotransferase
MIYPGQMYGDYTDDFVRMSLTQPVERIKQAMTRIQTVVNTIRAERNAPAARGANP